MIDTIDDLITALDGPEALGDLLGLGRTGVLNWSTRGYVPTGWHLRLAIEIKRRGLTVAPHLFEVTQEQLDLLMGASPPGPPSRPGRRVAA